MTVTASHARTLLALTLASSALGCGGQEPQPAPAPAPTEPSRSDDGGSSPSIPDGGTQRGHDRDRDGGR
jgi:hypothetical protein